MDKDRYTCPSCQSSMARDGDYHFKCTACGYRLSESILMDVEGFMREYNDGLWDDELAAWEVQQ